MHTGACDARSVSASICWPPSARHCWPRCAEHCLKCFRICPIVGRFFAWFINRLCSFSGRAHRDSDRVIPAQARGPSISPHPQSPPVRLKASFRVGHPTPLRPPSSGGMTVKIKKSYFTDAEASERAEPGPGVSMARSRSAPGSDPDRRHVCKPSIGAGASVLLA